MSERQYLAAKFNPWDQRTYTYHNDGDPVAVGDQVVVPSRAGRATVTVEAVGVPRPKFDTKAIIGKAQPPAPEPGRLL